LYRYITLSSPEELNKNNLGNSWFSNYEMTNEPNFMQQLSHLKYREGKDLYLVTAKVPISKVDIVRSLWQRSCIYLENEIVLKDDSNINIISLDKINKIRDRSGLNY